MRSTSWAWIFAGIHRRRCWRCSIRRRTTRSPDHYLDVPFDLSKVLFIATANTMDPVPGPLRDRMEVIEIPGYTQSDKLNIAKRYLVPRQLHVNGLEDKHARFLDSALNYIIEGYTREAGVAEPGAEHRQRHSGNCGGNRGRHH